jgi:hypothetical protein
MEYRLDITWIDEATFERLRRLRSASVSANPLVVINSNADFLGVGDITDFKPK